MKVKKLRKFDQTREFLLGLLKNLCKNGLPVGDVFEYAAVHILRFEKKMKQKEWEKKKLSRSMEKMGKI
jgi:hypothetical protein